MKILWSWLRDFSPTHLEKDTSCAPILSVLNTPEKTAQILTQLGTETEYSPAYSWAASFQVVMILSVEKHPQADALHVCRIRQSCGQELTIVCGAQNVRAGLKTILASPGCFLPGSTNPLTGCTLRGVESQGMLCSAQELWIEDLGFSMDVCITQCLKPLSQKSPDAPALKAINNAGIMEIPDHIPLGTTLQALLEEDWVLDLQITPNRGDLLSHQGVARELGLLTAPYYYGKTPLNQCFVDQTFPIRIHHTLRDTLSSFHFQSYVPTTHTSPALLRRRLHEVGIKTHHLCVDVTNYVACDIGQPMHAFDAHSIKGDIFIRFSQEGESFEALDHKVYTLPEKVVVLVDDEGIIAVPGIMGSARTRCLPTSSQIIMEAAYLPPESIAYAGQHMGVSSQSRIRFERGIDPFQPWTALQNALGWITPLNGEIASFNIGSTLNWPTKPKQGDTFFYEDSCWQEPLLAQFKSARTITFPLTMMANLIGVHLDEKVMIQRLQQCGAWIDSCSYTDDHTRVVHIIAPPWRHDWRIAQDCIEEILRVNGYEDIPTLPLSGQAKDPGKQGPTGKTLPSMDYPFVWRLRKAMAAAGAFEYVTWSFCKREKAEAFWSHDALQRDEGKNSMLGDHENVSLDTLMLSNPISQELNCMRPSLLPHLLDSVSYHVKHAIEWGPFFEIGAQFSGLKPENQQEMLTAIFPLQWPLDWQTGPKKCSLHDVKSWIQSVLYQCGHRDIVWGPAVGLPSWYHQGHGVALYQKTSDDTMHCIGYVGLLHPKMTHQVYVVEISFNKIRPCLGEVPFYAIPDMQAVEKDLSFFLPESSGIGAFMAALKQSGGQELSFLKLIDIYYPPSGTREKIDQALDDAEVLAHVSQNERKTTSMSQLSLSIRATFQPIHNQTFSSHDLQILMDRLVKAGQSWGATLRGALMV